MAEFGGAVQQQGAGNGADGTTRTVAVNRMGGLVVTHPAALYDQWLRAGKVFEAHFATEGGSSTIEANATVDLTEPFFRLTVPSSKIVVPITARVWVSTVFTTADAFFMTTSDTDTYTSGGAAPDVRNMATVSSLDSALGTTACTSIFDGDSVLTEAALTNPRMFGAKYWVTGDLFSGYEWSILKGDPMIMIHGTSSWQAQAILTGAKECLYSFVWAELDKSELVNS